MEKINKIIKDIKSQQERIADRIEHVEECIKYTKQYNKSIKDILTHFEGEKNELKSILHGLKLALNIINNNLE